MGNLLNFPASDKFQGGGGDGMEARVAKLEASVEHIEKDISDIKIDLREIRKSINSNLIYLLGALAALAGIMAKGFKWF